MASTFATFEEAFEPLSGILHLRLRAIRKPSEWDIHSIERDIRSSCSRAGVRLTIIDWRRVDLPPAESSEAVRELHRGIKGVVQNLVYLIDQPELVVELQKNQCENSLPIAQSVEELEFQFDVPSFVAIDHIFMGKDFFTRDELDQMVQSGLTLEMAIQEIEAGLE